MDLAERLESLLEVAEQMGVEIRAEFMGGDGGGLCTLKGQRVLFVDTSADLNTRYERTLAALAPLAELDDHFLVPALRQDIERQRTGE
jgi:hypothetical protein